MSSRVSFALAVILLLIAAVFRMWKLASLPPGLHQDEITDIRIAETVRSGRVEVFYDLGGEGHEGLYPTTLAVTTGFVGRGLIGYHMLSVWVGMLSLALVYALALRLFNPLAAVAALAVLSVGMWPTLLAREVSRETLLPLLVTAVLLALAIAFAIHRRHRVRVPSTTAFAALGILLGVGFYVHPAGFTIALASMAFIAYMLLSYQPMTRQTLGYIAFAILVMVIITMPYLISSIRLPHLGGADRLLDGYTLAGNPPLQALTNGLGGILFMGDANPVRNIPGRPLVDLISGMFMLVGFLMALRYWRKPRYMLLLIATLILAPVAFLTLDSPNFQSDTPLLPLLALFFGLGVSSLTSGLHGGIRSLAGVGLVVLLAFNIMWTGRDLFNTWPQLAPVQQAYHSRLSQLAHHLDVTAATLPTVVCASNPFPSVPVPDLTSRQMLELMMQREDAPIRYADCGTGLVLANGGERQQIIMLDGSTLHNMHPYLQSWVLKGQVLDDPALPPQSVIILDVSKELADTVGRFTTTAPAGYAPEAPGGEDLVAPPIPFGNNLTFLGYDRAPNALYPPGGIFTSITYWRADGSIPDDLRLFTHVLFDPSSIVAQTATISVSPGELQNRDVFIQITFVPLPPSIPQGVYNISIGAFRQSTDLRLVVLDGARMRGTRLFVGQITVQ